MQNFRHWHYNFWGSKSYLQTPSKIILWFISLPLDIGATIVFMPYDKYISIQREKKIE